MRGMYQQLGNLGTVSAFGCRHRETKKKPVHVSEFLGPVRKTAKTDYQFRHVCPFFRMEQLSSDWTDLDEI